MSIFDMYSSLNVDLTNFKLLDDPCKKDCIVRSCCTKICQKKSEYLIDSIKPDYIRKESAYYDRKMFMKSFMENSVGVKLMKSYKSLSKGFKWMKKE